MKQIYLIVLIVAFTHFANAQVAKTNSTIGTVINVPAAGTHISRTFTFSAGEFTSTSLTEVEMSIQLILGNGTPPTLGGYGVHEDLNVRLVSPSGTTVDLIQDRWGYWTGGAQTNSYSGFTSVNGTMHFDDDHPTNVEPVGVNEWTTGNFAPHNALSAFDGENAAGTWTLHISDGNNQFAPNDYIQFVTATLTVTSGAPLSVEGSPLKEKVKIFPNPTTNFVTISGLNKTEDFTIYNMLGKKIKKGTLTEDYKINMENLINGVYFLKLPQRKPIKIIKQH